MKLNAKQRKQIFDMFGGKCAYCGHALPERKWHADHIAPVYREYWKKGGGMERPQHDHIGNLFPACIACNIHKHAMGLEEWRVYLQQQAEMARRNSAPFRHAERFGMIKVFTHPIVFYFESLEKGVDSWELSVNDEFFAEMGANLG